MVMAQNEVDFQTAVQEILEDTDNLHAGRVLQIFTDRCLEICLILSRRLTISRLSIAPWVIQKRRVVVNYLHQKLNE